MDKICLIRELESLIIKIKKSDNVKYDLSKESILFDFTTTTSPLMQTKVLGHTWDISVTVMK